MTLEDIGGKLVSVGAQLEALTKIATKHDGQIASLTTAMENIARMAGNHDAQITAIREDSARRSGISHQSLAIVVGLLISLLTLTGTIATTWSAVVNERDACKVLLVERDRRISDLHSAHARELAQSERITRLESRLVMNNDNVPIQ